LRNIPVPLPPTSEEQLAIAEALGDVGTLVGTLDKLIAKKHDLKQAAMQQLLTGKRRLRDGAAHVLENLVADYGDVQKLANIRRECQRILGA